MPTLRMKPPIDDITRHLENMSSKVLKRADIETILVENREFWRLSKSVTVNRFIEFLMDKTKLEMVEIEFPKQNYLRYTWGTATFYEIVASLLPNSYFTHYTAVSLHELTDQIPNTIYLNSEQAPKKPGAVDLDQSKIDAAFKRPVRESKNIGLYDGRKICLLNGMHTGQLGVMEMKGPNAESILSSDIERTLIDIAVRPVYAGGVFEVQKAYQAAQGKFSVNKLSAMLKKMKYAYPYHQVIGFYLDNAGNYKKTAVDLLRKFDMTVDFYLTHDMKEMAYSKKWRLYYPAGLQLA